MTADFGSREDRVRTPVRGLRQRLLVALRAKGVTARFRTDHLRRGGLVVMSSVELQLPFTTFEGLPVRWVRLT